MEYEGIIFWGVDHDVFAANVGRYLSKNPPREVKVISLEHMSAPDGLKAYLQLHPELKNATGEEQAEMIGEDFRKRLRSADLHYIRNIIAPYENTIFSRHNAKFIMELHSTNMHLEQKVDITCHMNRFNKKGTDLLRKYADEVIYREKDLNEPLSENISGFRVFGNVGTQYHLIQLEFWTDSDLIEEKHAIRSVGEFTGKTLEYLATNYRKLWKKHYRK